jgi:glycosyltransferase involved in cell wall biosynthesis
VNRGVGALDEVKGRAAVAHRRRVFLLQEIVPSYRVPVFKRLAELADVDLTVFYSRPSHRMMAENLRNSTELARIPAVELALLEFGGHAWQPGILARLVRERPDVFIAGQGRRFDMLLALLTAKMLGIRVLWFLGGVPYVDDARNRAYWRRGRSRSMFAGRDPRDWLFRRADGLIVYSQHAARHFAEQGFPRQRIWVAPNSPDTDALETYRNEWLRDPGAIRSLRRQFCTDDRRLLFSLGRLNKDRQMDVLLRALAHLRDRGLPVALAIVGDGEERPSLEGLIRELALEDVHFVGAIYDERELARYFLIANALVLPGVASLAVKMAMTLGTAVVTVDYGLEVHDVEDGVNALIFPMGNAVALADRLQRLLASDDLARRLSENAYRTVSERVNIGLMVDGFRKAISGAPSVGADR